MTADDYERKHMPGAGEMLLRHKVTSPLWVMLVLTALPLVLGAVPAIGLAITGKVGASVGAAAAAAALAALFAFINVTFATARIAVSEGEVHVQLGMAGPKIPISEIATVRLGPSGSNRLGMGVRKDLRRTTTFTLWGNNEAAVHIERTDGSRLVLVVTQAEAIVAAIQVALARHRTRVGVEVGVTTAGAEAADRGLAERPDEVTEPEAEDDRSKSGGAS